MPAIKDIIWGKLPPGWKERKNKRALVYVDAANLIPYLNRERINFDWHEFKLLVESIYSETRFYYYEGEITEGYYKSKHPGTKREDFFKAKKKRQEFSNSLKACGYTVRSKPIAEIHLNNGGLKYKCNMDVEIAIDVMDTLHKREFIFDFLIICSGDGDFCSLLRRVKREHKETHAIAAHGRFNDDLKSTANHFDYVSDLVFWDQKLRKK